MRKLFGWKAPSEGRHRLGNPAFPELVHFTPAAFQDVRSHRGTPAVTVAAWTPGPRGILA